MRLNISKLIALYLRHRHERRGFSLLELLIALTILAIALVPVAYFYSKSLQMVEQSSIRTRALMLAHERLAEIEQLPYESLRSNVTPSKQHLQLYRDSTSGGIGSGGIRIDTNAANEDWFGYDFELASNPRHAQFEWAGMFAYPLPLDYNPYRPQTQGYNNLQGVGRYTNVLPAGSFADPHVNFNDGTDTVDPATGLPVDERCYEYEPIGFYTRNVVRRNQSLGGPDIQDIRMSDRRSISMVEPSINNTDFLRSGTEQQADHYGIYGRRTIIMDVRPMPPDTDPSSALGGPDNYAPSDERDGGATALNPYPQAKGPDNKFQIHSEHGTKGKMVIVQVFWLPRDATEGYIAWDDLNSVELRTFIAATNESSSEQADDESLSHNDFLVLTPVS
jgi:prepilin-type N-terminal cleavage/methylation domain-containing protein